jgi:hypothetical protein
MRSPSLLDPAKIIAGCTVSEEIKPEEKDLISTLPVSRPGLTTYLMLIGVGVAIALWFLGVFG